MLYGEEYDFKCMAIGYCDHLLNNWRWLDQASRKIIISNSWFSSNQPFDSANALEVKLA